MFSLLKKWIGLLIWALAGGTFFLACQDSAINTSTLRAGVQKNAPPQIDVHKGPNPRILATSSLVEVHWQDTFELYGKHHAFGGLSDLSFSRLDKNLWAVSDKGALWRLKLIGTQDRITSLKLLTVIPLENQRGTSLAGIKAEGDGEAISWLNNDVLIAFEQRHRISRYRLRQNALDLQWAADIALPLANFAPPRNSGIEAMTALEDGRVVFLLESFDDEFGAWPLFLSRSKVPAPSSDTPHPLWQQGYLRGEKDFAPVAIRQSGPGEALVLLRKWSVFGGFESKIQRLFLDDLDPNGDRPGNILHAQTLMHFKNTFPLINYEGLEICQKTGREEEGRRLLMFLVTDDNFMPFQKTALGIVEMHVPAFDSFDNPLLEKTDLKAKRLAENLGPKLKACAEYIHPAQASHSNFK